MYGFGQIWECSSVNESVSNLSVKDAYKRWLAELALCCLLAGRRPSSQRTRFSTLPAACVDRISAKLDQPVLVAEHG